MCGIEIEVMSATSRAFIILIVVPFSFELKRLSLVYDDFNWAINPF
jgi:hypothetical protein